MKLVQHPNVVRLYEVIDTQTKLFLILELGDYDMFEYIMRRGLGETGAGHHGGGGKGHGTSSSWSHGCHEAEVYNLPALFPASNND
jgi:hypothetical protein